MRGRLVGASLVLCLLWPGDAAAADWWAVRIDAGSYPTEIVAERGAAASDSGRGGLPDGRVATCESGCDIAAAWYEGPTARYGHGVIGDAIEGSVLAVELAAGPRLALTLPENEVFEDRTPRLADLDGDGSTEVVTIRSSLSEGASVTVYGVAGGLQEPALVKKGSTGFIGRPNRWLNVAGIAAFRGSGSLEIAYVETPHIGGTLYLYAFEDGGLKRVGRLRGFSNHAIGSRELLLSAVADVDSDGVPELALPSDGRRQLKIAGFREGKLRELAAVPLPGRIDKAIAVEGNGRDTRFIVGLDSGAVYEITR